MVSERDNGLIPLRREYALVWHGFDRNEVRQYLDHVEAHLRRIAADRDAAMAQASTLSRELENARREMSKLRSRVEELKKPPERLEDLDERMQRTAHLANTRAEEITNRAQLAAEKHWTATSDMSGKLKDRYASLISELDTHAEALQAEHQKALQTTRAEVQQLTVESARLREKQDAEAEKKRRTLEQEFENRMTTQRVALEKHVADQQAASKNQAERRISEATAEAKRRLDEATAEAKRRLDDATAAAEECTSTAAKRVQRLGELGEQARARLREADEVLKRNESALVPLKEEVAVAANARLVGGEDRKPQPDQPATNTATNDDVTKPAMQKPAQTPDSEKTVQLEPAKPKSGAAKKQVGARTGA